MRRSLIIHLHEEIMLTLQNIAYAHPNKDVLFDHLSLTINKRDKIALIGNNGIGKSTLLKIMAGELQPEEGTVTVTGQLYYIPQIVGQFNQHTVAEALRINDKIQALKSILDGDVTEANLALLNEDWTIEERCREALAHWQMSDLDLAQQMGSLSGGQKAKVFLAGIMIHQPEIVLMDEPGNHLDAAGRDILYDYIRKTPHTLVIVSHDRVMLNLLDMVCELNKHGIT